MFSGILCRWWHIFSSWYKWIGTSQPKVCSLNPSLHLSINLIISDMTNSYQINLVTVNKNVVTLFTQSTPVLSWCWTVYSLWIMLLTLLKGMEETYDNNCCQQPWWCNLQLSTSCKNCFTTDFGEILLRLSWHINFQTMCCTQVTPIAIHLFCLQSPVWL